MRYELWDADAGNMIGSFETETEALAEVRGLLAVNASGYADDLALGQVDASGGALIAEGAELAARALTARATGTRRSA